MMNVHGLVRIDALYAALQLKQQMCHSGEMLRTGLMVYRGTRGTNSGCPGGVIGLISFERNGGSIPPKVTPSARKREGVFHPAWVFLEKREEKLGCL